VRGLRDYGFGIFFCFGGGFYCTVVSYTGVGPICL